MKNEKPPSENELEKKIIISEIRNQENNLEKDESEVVVQMADIHISKLNTNVSGNNHTTEKELSEGEASSGFETVSSIDYNIETDDLDLSIAEDEDDINVVIQIENELALQNGRDRRICHWKGRNKSPVRYRNRTEVSSSDYNRRQDSFVISRQQKYWKSKSKERRYNYDRRDKKSTEREDFFRKSSSHDHDWSRNNIQSKRQRSTRRSDYGPRSRHSTSSERNYRSRSSRSLERTVRVTSPRHKDRKTEGRHSGSFEKSTTNSNLKRNSLSRKRRGSRSPISTVWKRLDDRISPERVYNVKNSLRNFSRKKERTPFLVELERKLKEAGQLKNEPTNESMDKNEISINLNNAQPVPELPAEVNQTTTPSMYFAATPPNIPGVGFPFQYTPLPTVSVNNLPLVPGPSGLPVHITATGEQIPHDLDGKCIPVGPNGYYLPLDPTGRLFPHIVSPGNQAVPIHMTEDGVLRLPNSDPVPYGPSHQLPVNIDGSIILIGPDSKPLYPCLNLPRHPPLDILNMMNSLGTGNTGLQETAPAGNKEIFVTESQQQWNINEVNFEAPDKTTAVENIIQIPPQNTDKTDLLRKKKKARERCNDLLKSIKIGGELNVKEFTSVKFSQKKTAKVDTCSSGTEMISESGDSYSTSRLQSRLKPLKGSSKTSNPKKETEDLIAKKVKHAIKSLCEKNYKPPVFGRFIVSDLEDVAAKNSPNESPLLRNRLVLPFLIPNAEGLREKDELSEKTAITFKFLPQKKTRGGEKPSIVDCSETQNENLSAEKIPVLTFDFAMQCDFTSVTIKNLTSKVTELEMEVVRLRNINANLLDGYRSVQAMNQKKGDELRKALLEIRDRNKEIQSLKRYV